MPVLIEQKVSQEEDLYEGYTPNYIKIMVKCNKDNIIGNIVPVKIISWQEDHAQGSIDI